MWVLMPPTVPINHYGDSKNQQNRTARPILLFHANIFRRRACFEHSNFFKVKVLVPCCRNNIVVRKHNRVTAEQLLAFGKQHLSGYKRPRYVEFVDSLPKSNVGKILRKELRKREGLE